MHQKGTFLPSLILYYLPVLMFLHRHFICTLALISVIRQEILYLFFFIIAPKKASLILYYLLVLMFHHWHFICTSALILVTRQERSYVFFFLIAHKKHIFACTNTVLFACLNVSSPTFYLHFCIDFSNKTGEISFILFYNCTKKAHFCLR